MPYITQVAIGRREKLTVFGNDYDTPDGTGVRDYIHVVDLAEGHLCAIQLRRRQHTGCEIFNLGTGHGVSVLEMVNTFSEVNHVPVPYVIGPRRAGDLATVYADPAKAKADPWLGSKKDACRHVPRQLELAEQKSELDINEHNQAKAYSLPAVFICKNESSPRTASCFFMSAFPIFPASRPASIFGDRELNFCVRYGNRWTLTPINTDCKKET